MREAACQTGTAKNEQDVRESREVHCEEAKLITRNAQNVCLGALRYLLSPAHMPTAQRSLAGTCFPQLDSRAAVPIDEPSSAPLAWDGRLASEDIGARYSSGVESSMASESRVHEEAPSPHLL